MLVVADGDVLSTAGGTTGWLQCIQANVSRPLSPSDVDEIRAWHGRSFDDSHALGRSLLPLHPPACLQRAAAGAGVSVFVRLY